MTQIILASSSPYRKELLSRLRLPFEIFAPHIDEAPLLDESFEDHVKRLSLAKAHEVAKQFPHAYCIGSDEVAGLSNEILGKPLTHENAKAQLEKLSGKTVTFYTGVALVQASNHFEEYRLAMTHVTFRSLSDEMIEAYLQKEKPYHSSASFKSETLGSTLILRCESHDPTAIIGLPLIELTNLFEKAGISVLNHFS